MTSAGPSNGTITVHVDLISWVNQFVDGPGTGTTELQEQVRAGDTVRTVLKQVSERFPKLKSSLWDENDRSQLGPHIEIIVNDAILGVSHELDSSVQDGDRITLTGQYIGG
ncbi:MAG TPA: MoaD/ThiS family protein [bacterium]|nr:MoaD/ThiS family protein [bacterium]